MKIILDANIFISAFFWKGNPQRVIDRVTDGLDDLFMSMEILEEITEVINRPKFNVDKKEIENYISGIKKITKFINPSEQINASRDIKDNKYLECAVMANADYIISGDIHLLELKKHNEIIILKAKEYLDIVECLNNI
ncbi:MAG: putative toxin-antitoxin system toxin component, PIN family [Fibromonadales bacterium]|nr:putative toxin-antitoxin system toxin component, PIN family [Fibromonadales bacterium]